MQLLQRLHHLFELLEEQLNSQRSFKMLKVLDFPLAHRRVLIRQLAYLQTWLKLKSYLWRLNNLQSVHQFMIRRFFHSNRRPFHNMCMFTHLLPQHRFLFRSTKDEFFSCKLIDHHQDFHLSRPQSWCISCVLHSNRSILQSSMANRGIYVISYNRKPFPTRSSSCDYVMLFFN